jgi:hypothetical protein
METFTKPYFSIYNQTDRTSEVWLPNSSDLFADDWGVYK